MCSNTFSIVQVHTGDSSMMQKWGEIRISSGKSFYLQTEIIFRNKSKTEYKQRHQQGSISSTISTCGFGQYTNVSISGKRHPRYKNERTPFGIGHAYHTQRGFHQLQTTICQKSIRDPFFIDLPIYLFIHIKNWFMRNNCNQLHANLGRRPCIELVAR
jgi:hypothetical protein